MKRILSDEHKRKISKALTGRRLSDATKQKISKNHARYWKEKEHTEEYKRRMSESCKGKKMSDEHRKNISKSRKGMKLTEEHKRNISERCLELGRKPPSRSGVKHSKTTKLKISEHNARYWEGAKGKEHPAWIDGVSFEPYCPKFNYDKKEEIRNRDERRCVLCGKSEILNGRRLAVHHIDGDKMQGCYGKRWYLATLCISCNSKSDTIMKEFLIVSNVR